FIFSLPACVKSNPDSTSATAVLETPVQESEEISDIIASNVIANIEVREVEKFIRGIHLTAFMTGSSKQSKAVIDLLKRTELNTVVIDLKESDGQLFINGVKPAMDNELFFNAIPNLDSFLAQLKENNIYAIARIVAFRDNAMPRKKPNLAIKTSSGDLWMDKGKLTWLDPYNKDVWDYIIQIAERAADIGFDEIQFDYIRFPTDGELSSARYSKAHSNSAASNAIIGFLKEANSRLKAKNVKISIDVFGLTTTSDDMGIGQKIVEMAQWVDYISPMVYPSHYAAGTYGVKEPNKAPYRIVYESMKGAVKKIPAKKLRPWLQDFTIFNYKYGKEHVKSQIQACYDNNIGSWLLWNPRCVYTTSALEGPNAETVFHKTKN
ncbi:MAG: putative glycoside hydrolase, partial [Endomicrobium sp.]|nr:putative glycoside hydrolase [Endomicrobium sp.]